MFLFTHETFTHHLIHEKIFLKFLVSLWLFLIWDVIFASKLPGYFENVSLDNMRNLISCWFVYFTFYLWKFLYRWMTIYQRRSFPIIKFLDGVLIELGQLLLEHLKWRQLQYMIITTNRLRYNRICRNHFITSRQRGVNVRRWLTGQPVKALWDLLQWYDPIS